MSPHRERSAAGLTIVLAKKEVDLNRTSNQRVLLIGDTHCSFDVLEAIIAKERSNGVGQVLHCGDIGLYDARSAERLSRREVSLIERHGNPIHLPIAHFEGEQTLALPLIGVPGNHEDFTLVEELERGQRSLEHLQLLTPGQRVSLAVGSQSLTVMGLGRILPAGVSRTNRTHPKYICADSIRETMVAAEQSPPDVLLLHEPPRLYTPASRRLFGSPVLLDLIERMSPRLVLFGHMHLEMTGGVGESQLRGLGYGVRGRYALLDEDLQVTFHSLDGRDVQPLEAVPVHPDDELALRTST